MSPVQKILLSLIVILIGIGISPGFRPGNLGDQAIARTALATPHETVQETTQETTQETAYDRVMRTGVLRCGYGQWPPFISRDLATGAMSGIFYDYIEKLGQALHLKIDWGAELGTGDFAAALASHRIDAMCGSVWPNAARAREMDFIRPVYYSPIYAYARHDDHRFDHDLSAINSPQVTIVTMDGEMAGLIANRDYPSAHLIELPQLSTIPEFFVNIDMKKADVTFSSPALFKAYAVSNPGKLRQIPTPRPVRVFGNSIAIAKGENLLRQMLDHATQELIDNGDIERILKQHPADREGLLLPALSYQTTPQ